VNAHSAPTFDDLALFLRDFARISPRTAISPETRIEADLGITGDDGDDLLKGVATHFRTPLASPEDGYRSTFGLAPNEYLFHSEGVDMLGFGRLLARLFRRTDEAPAVVRDLTVGELFAAILRRQRDGGNV
jgi:hypothetical protein